MDTDFGSTTAVIAYVRKRVTPAMLWSAVGALTAALVASITWIVSTQSDIHALKDTAAEGKRSVAEMRGQLEVLHRIDTQIAVMTSKLDDIAAEVDRQRQWRERITEVAESPPHARRR